MSDYDDALARALAYTDDVGLSDGTDRPATDAADVVDHRRLEYRGQTRHGVYAMGSSIMEPAALVEELYRKGWRVGTQVSDAATQQIVGEIVRHPDTRRRIWWADAAIARAWGTA